MSQDQTPFPPASPPVRRIPFITIDGTTLEQEQAWHISGHLGQLSRYAQNFYQAVALFDVAGFNLNRGRSSGQPLDVHLLDRFVGWQLIAARDGAMTIFHFAKSLEALTTAVAGCGPLKGQIDHDAFRSARRAFRERFKDFEPVRHAVAHSGELAKNSNARSKNAFSGSVSAGGLELNDVSDVMISDMLSGRTFTNTFEGKLISYDVSWENWAVLDASVETVFALFQK